VLLALTQAGVSPRGPTAGAAQRDEGLGEGRKDFKTELLADPEVTAALSPAEIEEKFDLGYHTKHVDTIFARVQPERRPALRRGARTGLCRAL
jgi:adenylosuccinate lyase